jgi:hypothetical protein
MLNFIKFYYHKVIRRWWSFFIFIPILLPKTSEFASFYLGSDIPNFQKLTSILSPWWKWITILVFLLANIHVIYEVWKEKKDESSSKDDQIPEKYVNISKKLDHLLPSKSVQIREGFSSGYKCLTELKNKDLNTAICVHFGAYKEIRLFLRDLLKNGNEVTVEVLQIRSKFEANCSQLEEINNDIGTNSNPIRNEHDVQKLIDDINDNLNSLFTHI